MGRMKRSVIRMPPMRIATQKMKFQKIIFITGENCPSKRSLLKGTLKGQFATEAMINPFRRVNVSQNLRVNLYLLCFMRSSPIVNPNIGVMMSGDRRSESIRILLLCISPFTFVSFKSI